MKKLILSALICVAGFAHAQNQDDEFKPVNDPLEAINRPVYQFNKHLDTYLLKPTAQVYSDVTPTLIQKGVSNGLHYIRTPIDVVLFALQGNGEQFSNAMGRLLLNTLGFGVLDIASEAKIPRLHTNMGETMGHWGVPPGPYVVLPILGGGSLRASTGKIVDRQVSVQNRWDDELNMTVTVLDVIDTRKQFLKTDNLMTSIMLDEYSFVRDILLQREQQQIENLD